MFKGFLPALLLVLAGCKGYANLPLNSLQIPLEANLKSLDPAFCSDLYEVQVVPNIYESLMQYSYLKRPFQVEPQLAEAMPTASKDGLTQTFHLKKGIRFQDSEVFPGGKGREVTVKDFIYSWKRLMDPTTQSEGTWIFDGYIKGLNEWRDALLNKTGKFEDPIAGLQTPDDYTLIIKLTKPYYQLYYVLAMPYSAVIPKEAVTHFGPEFLNHPVGTGPYLLERWTRGSRVILKRNPNFRHDVYPSEGAPGDEEAGLLADKGKALPFVDMLSFLEMTEEQPRWLNFMKGVFDWVKIPKDNFDGAIVKGQLIDKFTKRGVKLVTYPELDITYTGFNMDDPLIGKNANLRYALSLAYDRKTALERFYNNRGIEAQGPIPPGMDGYDENFKNPWTEYNVEKAKAYLAKAGYPGGKGLPVLDFSISNVNFSRQLAEFVSLQWSKIGVKISINVNSWPQFQDRLRHRKAQTFASAWQADYPDAQNMFQILYGKNASPGPNDSNWNDPEFNRLYEEALNLPPGPKRTAIYRKMSDVFAEKLPWLPNVQRIGYTLYHGWLRNMKYNESMHGNLKYIRVDEEAKRRMKAEL